MAGNHEIVEVGNRDRDCCASPSSSSSSSVYHSTCTEGQLQSQTEYETALDREIAACKAHWSELEHPGSVAVDSSGGEKGISHPTNREIVMSLWEQFPQARAFFSHDDDSFVLGKKIAEGAQAEIFEVHHKGSPHKFVLKVFKEGSSVLDLQKQWPLGMLNNCDREYSPSFRCSPVLGGTVVMNDRFAFRMHRCAGDLRKLMDKRMERNGFRAPFPHQELQGNMLSIARGMDSLHRDGIVHRDLKAPNVLIRTRGKHKSKDLDSLSYGCYDCQVADYECSVGVVGTAFWRAPEILQGVKARKITPELFTKEADVYSFAMTCYEMITGKLPFEGERLTNYDVVLRGDRPLLPKETKPWIKALLSSCWHANPKERPSFVEIVKWILGQNSKNTSKKVLSSILLDIECNVISKNF